MKRDQPKSNPRNIIPLHKLVERFQGKRDLLATWDKHPNVDKQYRNDLSIRVDRQRKYLVYRGGV